MKSIILPDGRWQHTERQSSDKTASLCLERARRESLPDAVQVDTDAACIGSAAHSVFEYLGEEIMQDSFCTLDTAVEMWNQEFTGWTKLPTFQWKKYSDSSARAFGTKCVTHWYNDIYPTLDPIETEWSFDLVRYEDDERVIRWTGTMDLYDAKLGLCDYKTSGRGPYTEWEYARWASQPTFYTWAFHETHYEDEDQFDIPFTYIVCHANGTQTFPVTRGPGDWSWQLEKSLELARLAEAKLPHWPLNDTHALCAPRWCQFWDECRGKHVGDKPWKSA